MMSLKAKYEHSRIIFLGVLAVLASSCGYRFAGQGNLPGGIPDLRVAVFENRTSETGVENIVTRYLIDEFVRRGVKAGGGPDGAHAVLSGSVESLQIHTISRSGQRTALERKVLLSVDIKLTGIDGVILWAEQGLTAGEAYTVESDKPATEQSRTAAIEKIARRLAEVVYTRMTDDF